MWGSGSPEQSPSFLARSGSGPSWPSCLQAPWCPALAEVAARLPGAGLGTQPSPARLPQGQTSVGRHLYCQTGENGTGLGQPLHGDGEWPGWPGRSHTGLRRDHGSSGTPLAVWGRGPGGASTFRSPSSSGGRVQVLAQQEGHRGQGSQETGRGSCLEPARTPAEGAPAPAAPGHSAKGT